MSSGVKLTMYLSYYDPNNELAVEPIELSQPRAQLLSSKNNHEHRNTHSIAVSDYEEADVRCARR